MNYLLFGLIVIINGQFHQFYRGLGERVQLRNIPNPSSTDSNNEAIRKLSMMISDMIAKETASQFATDVATTAEMTTNQSQQLHVGNLQHIQLKPNNLRSHNLRARNPLFKNPHRFGNLQRRMFARYHGMPQN